jgi:hypothetical protein
VESHHDTREMYAEYLRTFGFIVHTARYQRPDCFARANHDRSRHAS